MGALVASAQNYVTDYIKDKFKTIEHCKTIINLDNFAGLTDKHLTNAIGFFRLKCPVNNSLYKDLTFVYSMCLNKEEGHVDFAKDIIHQSLLELKLSPNRDLYVELISYLTCLQIEGGE